MTRSGKVGALPDLVYPVKQAGEELRYSLRSIATNARGLFRKVWLVGDRPEWARGVEHIEAGDPRGRVEDVRAKVYAATVHSGVADRFVLMNDDCYLIERIDRWQAFHMGPLVDHVAKLRAIPTTSKAWLRFVTETAEWMAEQGYPDGLTWQGHRPLLWDKARLRDALERYPEGRALDVIGLYDMAGADQGEALRGCNSKVVNTPEAFHSKMAELNIPWLSSNDASFAEGMIGGYIRGVFRESCRFEK